MTTSIIRIRTAYDGKRSTAVATRHRDGTWLVEVDGVCVDSAASERRMWSRVGKLEPWHVHEFALVGDVDAARLIPRLRFVDRPDYPDGLDEFAWGDVPLLRHLDWVEDSPVVGIYEPHPLVIDGRAWVHVDDLVIPLDASDHDLDLLETWHVTALNDGEDFYGEMPTTCFLAGPLPGQCSVVILVGDADNYADNGLHLRSVPSDSRAELAIALIDDAISMWSEWRWHTRRLYEAIALRTAHEGAPSVDPDDVVFDDHGASPRKEEFFAIFELDGDDAAAIDAAVARGAGGRRFVRWIVEGGDPITFLAYFPHADLIERMAPADDEPTMLEAPDHSVAERLLELGRHRDDAVVRTAWVERSSGDDATPGTSSTFHRARTMDARLGVVEHRGAVLPARLIECPWERPRRAAGADDALLAWFVATAVAVDDLFGAAVDWHVPTDDAPQTRARLLALVDEGIAGGRWRAFAEERAGEIAALDLAVPADPDDANWDDGSPEQREDVLALLVALQDANRTAEGPNAP